MDGPSKPTVDLKSPSATLGIMRSIGFTFWQDADHWLGHLDEYPDYLTQGTSLDDLKEQLLDLYGDLSSGKISGARRHAELEVA